jgi:leucyl-tRNA synthetase
VVAAAEPAVAAKPAGAEGAPSEAPLDAAYEGEGSLINSGFYNGLTTAEARDAIVAALAERGLGRQTVSYRLHDWTISRQRYWGPPIPMIYCHTCGEVPVPEADLPVRLPATENFRPLGTGASPLGAIPEFVQTTCPRCGGPARRETDVSDNFLDSAWYFLRYTSTEHNDRPWDVERLKRWLPVTFYAGGAEHSTMHHLYARFLWRALQDLGHLPRALGREPFARLRLHGMIIKDGAKMSKSRGNVVVPDAYVTRYGADVLRLYMEFMGPFERGGDFRDDGINGMVRLANRIWRLALVQPAEGHDANAAEALTRAMHRAIRKVTLDIEALSFNTAISTIMVYVNALSDAHGAVGLVQWKESLLTLIKLLAPFAPHLAEELWERLGQPFSVHRQPWPTFDEALAEEEQITLVAQVNGKLRDRLTAPVGLDERAARELVLTSEAVQRALEGATIRRVIHVPDRLVNIVTG